MISLASKALEIIKKSYPYAEKVYITEYFVPKRGWLSHEKIPFTSGNLLNIKNLGGKDVHLEIEQPQLWQKVARPDYSLKELEIIS